jgi:phage terminase large subunit GpA-like protein
VAGNEIVKRHLTRRLESRYRCRDKAVGGHVVNEPASILVLRPTGSDARDFVVSDVEPTFAASPALKRALSADREEGADRDTLTSRRFAGGSLKIVAAKAPRNLRDIPPAF